MFKQNALGYYIHARLSNYRKAGINKTDKVTEKENFTKGMNDQHKVIQQRIATDRITKHNKAQIQEYQDLLNFFLGDTTKGNTFFGREWTSEEVEEISNYLKAALKAEFGEGIKIDTNSLRGEILEGGKLKGTQIRVTEKMQKNLTLGARNKVGQGSRTPKEALQRRLSAMVQAVNQMQENVNNAKFIQQVKSLQQQWRAVKQDFSLGKTGKYVSTDKHQGFIQELNLVFDEWHKQTANQLNGKALEVFITLVNGKAEEVLGLGVRKAMKETLGKAIKTSGQKTKKNALLSMNVTSQIDFDKIIEGSSYTIHYEDPVTGAKIAATNATQQKVDVQVTLPELKLTTGINAKNLGNLDYGKISLLSGSSLLVLLQDDSRFANHYMNIMAAHNNPGEQETTVPTKQREYAKKMMKLTILSYAMRGGVTVYDRPGYHEDSAGLFLVNDNSQRAGIKIFTVDEIIRKAANDMRLVKWEGDPLNELSNDWVGDPNEMSYNLGWTRIAKMLSELHQMKIKMSISKRSLK